ncbi:hypothetical protein QBC44DRAFT_374976 [Cladorrhinum sp. PSN332]|nr:hypothetical protein QBC44DRAFT_374976 [Cladorrhinum sp. PSN332]
MSTPTKTSAKPAATGSTPVKTTNTSPAKGAATAATIKTAVPTKASGSPTKGVTVGTSPKKTGTPPKPTDSPSKPPIIKSGSLKTAPGSGSAAPAPQRTGLAALPWPQVPDLPPRKGMVKLVLFSYPAVVARPGVPISPLAAFAPHWALWVQNPLHQHLGQYMDADGSMQTGFIRVFKRSWNQEETRTQPEHKIPLGWMDGRLFQGLWEINTVAGNNERSVESEPRRGETELPVLSRSLETQPLVARCRFDEVVLTVEAPGPSMRAAGTTGRIVKRNCQNWVCEVGEALCENQIIEREAVDFLLAAKTRI